MSTAATNPFTDLVQYAHTLYEDAKRRCQAEINAFHCSGRSESRCVWDPREQQQEVARRQELARESIAVWGPRVQEEVARLQQLAAACYRAGPSTRLPQLEIERRVRALTEAATSILLWQRDTTDPDMGCHHIIEAGQAMMRAWQDLQPIIDAWLSMQEALQRGADSAIEGTSGPCEQVRAGQSEGAVADTSERLTPQQHAEIVKQLEPATRKAYWAFQYAESIAGKRLEDHEAYNLLREQGIPTNAGNPGDLTDYELPSLDTWTRHLRSARRPLGEQKYTPRGGRRKGKSIVPGDQIEQQKHDAD